MISMTSLEAQNQFGLLLDSSQRQAVTITRRGRPVAVVQAYQDYERTAQLPTVQMAKFISENFPLRGKEAGDALRRYFAGVASPAEQAQMTEDDVMQLLNDEK
jgi:prevent-host-death family protein